MSSFEDVIPAGSVFLITPNNDANLPIMTRAFSFVEVGALHIIDANGNEVTIPSGALAAGVMWPIRLSKVFATGTTATGLVGYAG